jgi:hypothetical protein
MLHLFGQHLLQAKMRSSRQPRLQQLLPQPLPQAALPPSHEGSMPQAGAGAAQVGAGAAQVGAGAAQAGAAQLGAAQPGAAFAQPLLQPLLQRLRQRDLQHFVSQQLLSQPQPLEPSIMSSSSNE